MDGFRARYVSISGCDDVHGTAVVVDVLRAFTTAAWAFALGADRIVLSADVQEALAIKARLPGALALKDSDPLPGFELSNSPVELQQHDLQGVTIVQRTTAGTVGAVAAMGAERLYCASFLNAAATAEAIWSAGDGDSYFVITGEDGAADEDQACAEYIAALVSAMPDRAVSEGAASDRRTKAGDTSPFLHREGMVDVRPYLQRVADSNAARMMAKRVSEGMPGVHEQDVEAAMEANRFDFVMMAREEHIPALGPVLVLRAYNRSND